MHELHCNPCITFTPSAFVLLSLTFYTDRLSTISSNALSSLCLTVSQLLCPFFFISNLFFPFSLPSVVSLMTSFIISLHISPCLSPTLLCCCLCLSSYAFLYLCPWYLSLALYSTEYTFLLSHIGPYLRWLICSRVWLRARMCELLSDPYCTGHCLNPICSTVGCPGKYIALLGEMNWSCASHFYL